MMIFTPKEQLEGNCRRQLSDRIFDADEINMRTVILVVILSISGVYQDSIQDTHTGLSVFFLIICEITEDTN